MILRLVSYLPLTILYGLSDVLYLVVFYGARYRHSVVRDNIKNSFPDKDPQEIQTIVKDFYRNFCDFLVEALKSITISEQEIRRRVTLQQKEVIERYLREGQSVLMMTSHHFNWEWLLFACNLQLSVPMNPIYKKLNNKYFNSLMLKTRSKFGGKPIEMQETLAQIVSRKSSVNVFGLVADQIPLPEAEKYWADFLNQETAFFIGSEKIAHMTKYPVVFAGMQKIKRGFYQVTFEPIAEPPYDKSAHEVLDLYINKAEKLIRQRPAEWLWSHRRWKHQKPIYAS